MGCFDDDSAQGSFHYWGANRRSLIARELWRWPGNVLKPLWLLLSVKTSLVVVVKSQIRAESSVSSRN